MEPLPSEKAPKSSAQSSSHTEASSFTKSPEGEVLRVSQLEKTYRIGFFRKRVEAVRSIDFKVGAGETFGLLGPNGAGKTTTIKMILGLVFPTQGSVSRFGRSALHRRDMGRIGYMPENPYVYQYLRPLEFLDFCGRLTGMPRLRRRDRANELLDRVGLRFAEDRPIGRFSKGMMQRIGLAQAMLHDPEFLILDEPMSGLDPIGRREIRELLLQLRKDGKTLLFSSHILSDVETLCDRVVILNQGKVVADGDLETLLHTEGRVFEVDFQGVDEAGRKAFEAFGTLKEAHSNYLKLRVESDEALSKALEVARYQHAQVRSVIPQRQTLEDLFVRLQQEA